MDKSTRRLPPGPKGHFLLGNLPEFGKDLLGFITQCAREYGDIVRLRLANRVAYLLNHPDYMEYVLVTNHRNFVKNSIHRSSRYFPDPEAFMPDRWADGLAKRLPKYAYFPFGGGPRICIGGGFAMMEAVLLLATIAQRFRLTLVPGHPIALYPSITLRPAYGVRVTLERRR